ncbi:MAG TPA: FAD-dependent oxidoreductase, partial [Longimicrobiales bacterium]|nr:FAD-dependent oxidoreductase [Longimicrobiales bacterium]
MTTDEIHLDDHAMTALEDRFAGALLRPGDDGYEEARTVWNGMIDRRPALIARCRGADDVVAAVDFARETGAPLSVRGGGHSVAGRGVCDDGVMIDLSPMNGVRVDPETRTARVGGGATWGDFDGAAQEHGLATTGGLVSSTGVAGLTLGGGIGYLARAHGLAADNLIACDVVTADGRRVRASEEENPDLFWGLRGGGGNFGVVTAFEFRLHPIGPEILTAQAFHPAGAAREVLEFYRDFTAGAPDEVMCYGLVAHVPPAPPFPEESHGDTTIALVAAYA